jgi:O-antigen ligase
MSLRKLIEDMELKNIRLSILLFMYSIFMVGFFFFTNYKLHNNILYFLVLLPYILTIKQSNMRVVLKSRIFQLTLILTLYLLFTLLWGEKGTFRAYVRIFIDFFTVLSFFTLTCELAYTYPRFVRYLLMICCWASAFAVPYFMYITSYEFIIPPIRFDTWGVIRGPIQIGDIYGMIFIILYFKCIKDKMFPKNIPYILLSVLALAILFLSQSRGPFLALYISLLAASFLTWDKKLFILLIGSTLVLIYGVYNGEGFIYNMIVTRADSYRLDLIRAAIPWIKERMLFGHGLLVKYSFIVPGGGKIDDPHNLYIETWVVGGIIGLCALFALIGRSVWQGYIYFVREKNLTYLVLVIYASICAFTDSDKIIDHPWPFYFYFWFPIALLSAYELTLRNDVHTSDPASNMNKFPEG